MAHIVTMPKLGLTMTEGRITGWNKKQGDQVKVGDVLFEVSTDKITNEVQAEAEGVLVKQLVAENMDAPVTAPVGIIASPGEDITSILKDLGIASDNTSEDLEIPAEAEAAVSEGPKKVVVLGGGPGGYVAAIRAAQLGAKVTLVEKEKVGGTCLNVGCIPTKVLLHTAELYTEMKEAKKIGINVSGVDVDWKGLQKRKNYVVKRLVSGVKTLLASNGVELVEGTGSLESAKRVLAVKEDGSKTVIDADDIIVASGSVPFMPPIEGIGLPGVVDSSGALSLDEIPKSMVIIGGGVIGVEFATVFRSFGCQVTIVEMLPHILPPIDGEVREIIRNRLVKDGVKIYNNAKVTEVKQLEEGLGVCVTQGSEEMVIEAEKVLVSVGRRAVVDGLNLDRVSIRTERGCIVVNDSMQTNIEGVYAIGDCTGKNMLAHVASDQGVVAAENIMGHQSKMDYKTVPACVYTKPEIASVGLTEEMAKDKGIDYKVGKFPLMANGKSLIMNETEGMIKIIADKKYGEVLGVHMIGPRATDLITEAALALRLEATIEEIITTVHAHPTVGEAVREAALAVDNIAIHMPKM